MANRKNKITCKICQFCARRYYNTKIPGNEVKAPTYALSTYYQQRCQ